VINLPIVLPIKEMGFIQMMIPISVAVAPTFTFCILRSKIGTNLKIFEEIAEA
jgi:hypothetical protein